MLEKEWLGKVSTAYEVYISRFGANSPVSHFVPWLYEQYGIVIPPISSRKETK